MTTLAPTGMTYDSLVQDIKDYLERGTLNDEKVIRQIPRIINNAERSLADRLKIQGYRYVLTSATTTGNPVIAKPDNWRNTVSINIGTGSGSNTRRTLRTRSYEYLRSCYPNDTQLGLPQFYADYDQNHWIIAPSPQTNYPFEAIVYRLPDLLGETNQQNYLTQYTPNLLLYSCLTAMEPFLRNDSRMPLWKSMREDEFNSVNTQDLMKMSDRAQIRTTS
jgi:hypothetical protein